MTLAFQHGKQVTGVQNRKSGPCVTTQGPDFSCLLGDTLGVSTYPNVGGVDGVGRVTAMSVFR